MAKAYFFCGDRYLRYDVTADAIDSGYPKPLANAWTGLSGTGFERDLDSVLDFGNGKLYAFKGDAYVRVDQNQNAVDVSITPIAGAWGGFTEAGFTDRIQAAINWGNGKAYLFRDDRYLRYDLGADRVDEGHPASIADNWPGLAAAGFGDAIDAAVNWGNGKVYFFKGDLYLRYDVAANRVDDGYPMKIADGWGGFAAAGFTRIDAAHVKLTGGAQPPPSAGLGPGSHVWYYDGKISQSLEIPRASWFPGSTSATDYQGHGKEIFNFVVHADGTIRRGRPHMRAHEGSFAWLNNNPGNITGVPGGPDYGQYPGKFNWHNFLIFPTRQAGYDAIAKFLRGPKFRDLTITNAFALYAPASDGNDPQSYARDVAAAAGVTTTHLIRDLDDRQMAFMQDKICAVEGEVAGVELTRDSPELPEAVRAQLV